MAVERLEDRPVATSAAASAGPGQRLVRAERAFPARLRE
jgi:hypothetical protein